MSLPWVEAFHDHTDYVNGVQTVESAAFMRQWMFINSHTWTIAHACTLHFVLCEREGGADPLRIEPKNWHKTFIKSFRFWDIYSCLVRLLWLISLLIFTNFFILVTGEQKHILNSMAWNSCYHRLDGPSDWNVQTSPSWCRSQVWIIKKFARRHLA